MEGNPINPEKLKEIYENIQYFATLVLREERLPEEDGEYFERRQDLIRSRASRDCDKSDRLANLKMVIESRYELNEFIKKLGSFGNLLYLTLESGLFKFVEEELRLSQVGRGKKRKSRKRKTRKKKRSKRNFKKSKKKSKRKSRKNSIKKGGAGADVVAARNAANKWANYTLCMSIMLLCYIALTILYSGGIAAVSPVVIFASSLGILSGIREQRDANRRVRVAIEAEQAAQQQAPRRQAPQQAPSKSRSLPLWMDPDPQQGSDSDFRKDPGHSTRCTGGKEACEKT